MCGECKNIKIEPSNIISALRCSRSLKEHKAVTLHFWLHVLATTESTKYYRMYMHKHLPSIPDSTQSQIQTQPFPSEAESLSAQSTELTFLLFNKNWGPNVERKEVLVDNLLWATELAGLRKWQGGPVCKFPRPRSLICLRDKVGSQGNLRCGDKRGHVTNNNGFLSMDSRFQI